MLFNSVFTIFWDFNIQCRVCYTAYSVNRRETVSLFKFPIKSLMIPFELNWPVSLITIYIYIICYHYSVLPVSPLFRLGSTISHALSLCGTVWGAGFRCLGLLPLSSPRDMSTAGEEFLECSCLFSWLLKSLDNRINCITEEARGRNRSIHKKYFIFSLDVTLIQP